MPGARYRLVAFVRFAPGASLYDAFKAAFSAVRCYNSGAPPAGRIVSVATKCFDEPSPAAYRAMALAYSELFTAGSGARQVLCRVRSIEQALGP